jgi:hypothetical protein
VLEGARTPPSQFAAHVPPELDAVCMRALAAVEYRYASAQEFADALEEAAFAARIQIAKPREVGHIARGSAMNLTNLPPSAIATGQVQAAGPVAFPDHTPTSLPSVASGITVQPFAGADYKPGLTGQHVANPLAVASAHYTGSHIGPVGSTGVGPAPAWPSQDSQLQANGQAVQATPSMQAPAMSMGKAALMLGGIAAAIVIIGGALLYGASRLQQKSVEPDGNGSVSSSKGSSAPAIATATATNTAPANTPVAPSVPVSALELDPSAPAAATSAAAAGLATPAKALGTAPTGAPAANTPKPTGKGAFVPGPLPGTKSSKPAGKYNPVDL